MQKGIKKRILESNQNEYLGKNKLVNKIAPLVTVTVITYQHVNYIKECLDSILMQKTSFPIELIIGEDESVDGTREFCMQYAGKYPDKIRLFLRERQYSANIDNMPDGCFNAWANIEAARGKYIACCEGDDYWTDPMKLQKQFEFMEANPDYSMTFHGANVVSPKGEIIGIRAPSPINTKYRVEEIILNSGGFFATSSLMYLSIITKNRPVWSRNAQAGDYALAIVCASHGPVGYIAQNMSVYRRGVSGSWSETVRFNKDGWTLFLYDTIKLLDYFDAYSRKKYSTAISIRKRKYIKTILKENNCNENKAYSFFNSKLNLSFKAKIEIFAHWYKPLIYRFIYNMFRQKPVDIYDLLQYADIAFEQKKWTESIKWYTCLQKKSTDNNTELWLKSNKNLVTAFLELSKIEEAEKQRWLAFKKVSGKSDILDLVQDCSGDVANDLKLSTKMLSRDKDNIYVCLHRSSNDNNKALVKLVEKCQSAGSSEPLIYETIRDNKLFKTTKHAKVPQLKKIIYTKEYTKIFLSYINSQRFQTEKIDLFNFGVALGEIALELNAFMPEYMFEMKPLRIYDQKILDRLFNDYRHKSGKLHMFSNLMKKDYFQDGMDANTTFKQLETFYSMQNKVEAVVDKIPKVFSHNDVTVSNVLMEENKPEYYFIGWKKATYNCIGSDIGSVLKWNSFKKAENKGRAGELEAELLKGYTSVTANYFQHNIDDLTFSYNLHFINSTINSAVSRNDLNLLKRISGRSKLLLEIAGY